MKQVEPRAQFTKVNHRFANPRDPTTERQRMNDWGLQSPKRNAMYLGSMKPFAVSVIGSLGQVFPGIPTTIKTMGVNITTIVYIRVLIIQIGSTIILMVVEAQGFC